MLRSFGVKKKSFRLKTCGHSHTVTRVNILQVCALQGNLSRLLQWYFYWLNAIPDIIKMQKASDRHRDMSLDISLSLMLMDILMSVQVWDLFYNAGSVRDMIKQKIQEESLRTYLFSYSSVYDSLSLDILASMFELDKAVVHSIVSKMIINEELMVSHYFVLVFVTHNTILHGAVLFSACMLPSCIISAMLDNLLHALFTEPLTPGSYCSAPCPTPTCTCVIWVVSSTVNHSWLQCVQLCVANICWHVFAIRPTIVFYCVMLSNQLILSV